MAALVAAAATPACARCGRPGYDSGRLTDGQRGRLLELLRAATLGGGAGPAGGA